METSTTKLDFLSYKLASNDETFGMTFGEIHKDAAVFIL